MKNRLYTFITAIFWLGIWQIAAMAMGNEFLIPSPLSTLKTLAGLAATSYFWNSTFITLLRVCAGFLVSMFAGTLMGIICSASKIANILFMPVNRIIKATPVTSFILLVILWLSKGLTPVFTAFLMVAPIYWTNVQEGILATDRDLLEMGRVFGFSPYKKLKYIYAPSVLPQFLAASTTGLGFAWKAGVAAEVISPPAFSIGRSLYESKLYLETPDLFAWTAVVILLSMLFEKIMVYAIQRVRKW